MSRPPGLWYAPARAAVSAAALLCSALTGACAHPRADSIRDVLEAYDEAATRVSWPGFAPADIPLVLYDDGHTYLMRHPAPPEPFRSMRGGDGVAVADTLLPGMSANTDVDLAGVRTAVARVVADGDRWDASRTGAVLLHEAFHVYQTGTHPHWTANEVDLFTYPFRSARLLQLRRLEGGALRRAISAPDSVRELCWAQAFLRARAERFDRLPGEARAYERSSELREGLARWVQALALGTDPQIPADGFLPEDVRERAYETGHAQAVLLDRLAPSWKQALSEAGEEASLEGLLDEAIGAMEVRHCGASPDEVARARAVAAADSAALADRDRRSLAAFEGAAGWSVEIAASRERPLQPERFDPLNVRVLDDRTVLHGRWLIVSNESISAEALERDALTRGLPGHPLFAGLDRFLVTGLREPEVIETGDTIRIVGDGLTVTAVGATLDRDGQRIRVVGG